MAKKDGKTKASTKVTRIKANDTASKKSKVSTASSAKSKKTHKVTAQEKADKATAEHLEKLTKAPSAAEIAAQKAEKQSSSRRNPLRAISEYFRGAWYELRQVRWPDRATTWQMTGALLAFVGFFAGIILLLDALFKYLFRLMIG